jgi:hypothetical protein
VNTMNKIVEKHMKTYIFMFKRYQYPPPPYMGGRKIIDKISYKNLTFTIRRNKPKGTSVNTSGKKNHWCEVAL